MIKRIALFLATNLAVILVLSVVLRLLGVDSILDERNAGINYQSLLVLSLVIGFGGSFISLAISKWMAKRSTGARVITQPSNATESWLLKRRRAAGAAGRNRYARSGYLRFSGHERVRHRRAPQRGTRCGQHRAVAEHAERRGRGGTGARDIARRQR